MQQQSNAILSANLTFQVSVMYKDMKHMRIVCEDIYLSELLYGKRHPEVFKCFLVHKQNLCLCHLSTFCILEA